MNIIMKNFESDIYLPETESKEIDEEAAIYFIESEKIALLNPTATVIWNIITSAVSNGKSAITYKEIFESFIRKVDITSESNENIEYDIEELINKFIKERIVVENIR